MPWQDDFSGYPHASTPRYLSDQCGVFEVVRKNDGKNVLRQVIPQKPIEWQSMPWPHTIAGGTDWRDYRVTCTALIPEGATARLMARVGSGHEYGGMGLADHYQLALASGGNWSILGQGGNVLSSGTAPGSGPRTLSLECRGTAISAFIDGKSVGSVSNAFFEKGMVGLGCGKYESVEFARVAVEPLEGDGGGRNLIHGATATASCDAGPEFSASQMLDDNPKTSWCAPKGKVKDIELTVKLPRLVRMNQIIMDQGRSDNRTACAFIQEARIEVLTGGAWKDVGAVSTGYWIHASFEDLDVEAIRLRIDKAKEAPGIREIRAYLTQAAEKRARQP